MRNVFAALVGLLSTCVCLSAQYGGNEAQVAVYLKLDSSQPARVLSHLKSEAAELLRPAGVKLEWRFMTDARLHEDFQSVVVARFEGACDSEFDRDAPGNAPRPGALADTPVQDGRILPFTRVDCGAITRLTGQSLSNEARARREFLYGRALGRVLAHEIYHILGQTLTHANNGVAKPAFRASELLAESFAFNEPAITVLRSNTREAAPAAVGEEIAGR